MSEIPPIRLHPGEERRLIAGHPWVYANEIGKPEEAASAGGNPGPLAPGSLVRLVDSRDRPLGLAFYNPHSLIAARLITRDTGAVIDRRFWQRRLERALSWRQRLIGGEHYRLAHAEADGLPGCVIDRFGDVVVIQPNTAGMDGQLPLLAEALTNLLHPRAILAIADNPARRAEGLDPIDLRLRGEAPGEIEILENGLRFLADPGSGQKTGWFFDQRDNRALAARLAKDADVLDVYAYSGGFALQCLKAGAKSALALDRSAASLALAERSAALNGLGGLTARIGDAFAELAALAAEKRPFDLVLLDPPAFVKSRKDKAAGARAYRKLARLGAALVARHGLLMISSCSHHMTEADLLHETARGLGEAGRSGQWIYRGSAGPDHPIHPHLPESAYLKTLVFAIA